MRRFRVLEQIDDDDATAVATAALAVAVVDVVGAVGGAIVEITRRVGR